MRPAAKQNSFHFLILAPNVRARDTTAERRQTAEALAQWYEGGTYAQDALARVVEGLGDLCALFTGQAVAPGNTSPMFARSAARCAVLANAAAGLRVPPAPVLPFDADAPLLCSFLAAAAQTDSASTLAWAAETLVAAAKGPRESGAHTALLLLRAYWTARAHLTAAAGNDVLETLTVLRVAQARVRLALGTLDAALTAWPAASFATAGVDFAAFSRLREEVLQRHHALDQELARHELRAGSTRLADASLTEPLPLPPAAPPLPPGAPADLIHFDTLFLADVTAARAVLRNARPPGATAAATPSISFAEASAQCLPHLLGPNAKRVLGHFTPNTRPLVEAVALRAALAERLRWAKVLLDTNGGEARVRDIELLLRDLDTLLSLPN